MTKLRSIPPANRHHHRSQRRPLRAPTAHEGWQPRILSARPVGRRTTDRQAVRRTLELQMEALTEEIETWLPEFGEDALLHLYEARARLGEIVQDLTYMRETGN